MMRIKAIHLSSARDYAKYLIDGSISEQVMLDKVLAAANGYPWEAEEVLGDRIHEPLRKVTDGAFIEAYPIRWRHDMPTRMTEVLKINPELAPDRETLYRVLQCLDANGNRIHGKRYMPAYSNGSEPLAFESPVFAADKSVSVAWATAPPALRNGIRRSHQRAVETALRGLEEKLGTLRTGAQGNGPPEPGRIAWVTFFQTLNKEGQPHIHSHVAIPNVVATPHSTRIGSLNSKSLWGQFDHFRQVYHQELAKNLRGIGFDMSYLAEKKAAVAENVPERVVVAFSGRTNRAIELVKTREGEKFDQMAPWERDKAIKHALNELRPKKEVTEVGLGDWRERMTDLNWNPDTIYTAADRNVASQAMKSLREPERRAFGLRLPDGGYHIGGDRDLDWSIER